VVSHLPDVSVAERLAERIVALDPARLPSAVRLKCEELLIDVIGLCVTARNFDYVQGALAAWDDEGACTAIGHRRAMSAAGAAFVNGTAAHGEDFDDTFEGGPVHSGAVIVPAVLAACERERLGGDRLLVGLATGVELMCRLSLVAPNATHRAGFHPTSVFGALAAAGAVAAALRLSPHATASAIGIAGSMASGIIEYLAEGTSTKRMHAGWAAQSGLRAALMARSGFDGPRTVLDGVHGVYRAFAPSVTPDFVPLVDALGTRWVMTAIAFKPYACGTMTQPFIDCAIRLASDVRADDIRSIVCEVAEGTVHRLWEPLASKHRPPTPYAAKFSTPFCMAVGFLDRKAGLEQFTDSRVRDPRVLALAAKISYEINPLDEYPRNFSGHLCATLTDGTSREMRQPYMRGGARQPLTTEEIEAKFMDNSRHGGWSASQGERLARWAQTTFELATLESIGEFRS
jgi:2-methylcitrate dehydratase PrpD